ncbi:hypothetical protein AY606_12085 [Acinetobacter sp. SFB]|nr:hypothetical protein AY606_12085 [Acinetobacter sp. SFB]
MGGLETVKISTHSIHMGYQQIIGESAYPLPDGFDQKLILLTLMVAKTKKLRQIFLATMHFNSPILKDWLCNTC